ncbi:MAG: AAA family ATPase [Prevotella sp.]|nr:AAA family ATPase [Prevotella sp.]
MSSLKTEDFDIVLDALYQLYGDFKYLFLDEVQNIADWQLFINRLLRQKIHLFVTGSNSKLLSTELTKHLTDMSLDYKEEHSEFSIAVNNIIGKNKSERISLTDTMRTYSVTRLRPREFIVKWSFDIN